MQLKMLNGVKLDVLQNGYVGFLIFLDFDPYNLKCPFLKIIAHKSKILWLSKKRNICDPGTYKQQHTKFQSNISFLLYNGQKETGKGDDVTFF